MCFSHVFFFFVVVCIHLHEGKIRGVDFLENYKIVVILDRFARQILRHTDLHKAKIGFDSLFTLDFYFHESSAQCKYFAY